MSATYLFFPWLPWKIPGINELLKLSFSYILQTNERWFISLSHLPFPTAYSVKAIISLSCVTLDWSRGVLVWCAGWAGSAAWGQLPAEGLHLKSPWQVLWWSFNWELILVNWARQQFVFLLWLIYLVLYWYSTIDTKIVYQCRWISTAS